MALKLIFAAVLAAALNAVPVWAQVVADTVDAPTTTEASASTATATEALTPEMAVAKVNQLRALVTAAKVVAESKCKAGAYGLGTTEVAAAELLTFYEILLMENNFIVELGRRGEATKDTALTLGTSLPLVNAAHAALEEACDFPNMADMTETIGSVTATTVGEVKGMAFSARTVAANRCALGAALVPEFETIAQAWLQRSDDILSDDFMPRLTATGNAAWAAEVADVVELATEAKALLGRACPAS